MSSPLRVDGVLVPLGQWKFIDSPREGTFWEKFAPGSVAPEGSGSLAARAWRKVVGLFDHGRGRLFDGLPIMEVRRIFETRTAARFEAELLRGLPTGFVERVRRGEVGASIGAKPLDVERVRRPDGLEGRVYRRVEVRDISLTAHPAYRTTVALRSLTAGLPREEGLIYRTAESPLVVAPAWALETAPQYPRDYIADEPYDFIGDPDYPPLALL